MITQCSTGRLYFPQILTNGEKKEKRSLEKLTKVCAVRDLQSRICAVRDLQSRTTNEEGFKIPTYLSFDIGNVEQHRLEMSNSIVDRAFEPLAQNASRLCFGYNGFKAR